ncbi:MAG: site-specific DNA-methyltransferase [Thermoproteota archaeon]|nr:site-specific DNA-methyltransferase [Thermoproteota archaeon]
MTGDISISIDRSRDNIKRIINGDALTELKKFPNDIIDLCVTSPPYWNQRWYGDNPHVIGNESTVSDYIDNLIEIFGEVKRLLKNSGSCFVVISDKFNNGGDKTREKGFVKYNDRSIPHGSLCNIPSRFALAMTDRLGFVLKNDIIWEKPNGIPNGAAARRRFSINYEHVLFFVKDSREYYFQTQYEPYVTDPSDWNNKGPRIGGKKAPEYGSSVYSGKYWLPDKRGRIKRSIWRINTQKQRDKFYAAYPEKLVEIAINACCPENGIILDPFLGSGTTALAASKLNTKFIGIELFKKHIEMSHKRLKPSCMERDIKYH